MAVSDHAAGSTRRYEEMRLRIVEAASALINEQGVKGMGFAEIASRLGLTPASVAYYFRRKDDLAAACFTRSLARMEEQVAEAESFATPSARIGRLTQLHLEQAFDSAAPPMARLSDMRAMDDPLRVELTERFRDIFRRIRTMLVDGAGLEGRAGRLATVRTHVLVEALLWIPAWIGRYAPHDHDRIHRRMMEVFTHGLSIDASAPWQPSDMAVPDLREDSGARHSFLTAATRLINERGYKGASVDRIAAVLNVTKGSFYHHLDAKDDLVLACFQRSLTTIERAQRSSDAMTSAHMARLQSTTAALLAFQFSDEGPLLRTTALQALPAEVRERVLDHSNRVAGRFADTMIDGISEGSMRAVDPLIASQMLMAAINSAYEQRRWAQGSPMSESVELYASTIFRGIFASE